MQLNGYIEAQERAETPGLRRSRSVSLPLSLSLSLLRAREHAGFISIRCTRFFLSFATYLVCVLSLPFAVRLSRAFYLDASFCLRFSFVREMERATLSLRGKLYDLWKFHPTFCTSLLCRPFHKEFVLMYIDMYRLMNFDRSGRYREDESMCMCIV